MTPTYPTLWFFETGQWWDYLMLVVVIAGLALAAVITQRSKIAVGLLLVVVPVLLSIFWWPHSTAGTESAGWFPIVKQYSALLGSPQPGGTAVRTETATQLLVPVHPPR